MIEKKYRKSQSGYLSSLHLLYTGIRKLQHLKKGAEFKNRIVKEVIG
jgi:hypothetical protein